MDKHTIAHLKTVMDKEQLIDFLADQLEKVELELIKPLPIGELVHRLEGQTYEKWFSESDVKDLRERAQKAEAALSAANEKLKGDQVPVAVIVLSKNWPDTGRKVIDYYLEQIQHLPVGTELFTSAPRPAGFTVEGE
ncbi:TPA: hypothetical protein PXL93_001582 [Yersinia enterocolitica]|nr:hypothetical protein [Yersinia enterocolitica]HDL6899014.1 hypothetical protein [Yersinia enterocolitica]HDL7012373.1 hypothetical protein [Yersinia enterocolitica]